MMYSHTTSTLYFNWAEMGTTGAPSAIVPYTQKSAHSRISFTVREGQTKASLPMRIQMNSFSGYLSCSPSLFLCLSVSLSASLFRRSSHSSSESAHSLRILWSHCRFGFPYTSNTRFNGLKRSEGEDTKHYLNKLLNGFVLVDGHALLNEIDFVLQDNNVLEPHNLNGGEMLGCLWLRTTLIARNQQERAVHDGRTIQHSGHENVVTLHKQVTRSMPESCKRGRLGTPVVMKHLVIMKHLPINKWWPSWTLVQ